MVAVDFRPVIMICDYTAVVWINARGERRSIYICRTGVNRVVITENDSFMGKLPEHGSIFLADKIGSHPVPNHNYHMSVGFRFLCQQDAAC